MKSLALITGFAAASIATLFEKYVFNDWEFAVFLCIAILIDTLTGTYAALKVNKISSHRFRKMFEKVLIYAAVIFVAHGLQNFSSHNTTKWVFDWIEQGVYSALLVAEFLSIIENADKIRPGIIPKFIAKKLKQYNETGNIDRPNADPTDGVQES
jgi:phage-related holin